MTVRDRRARRWNQAICIVACVIAMAAALGGILFPHVTMFLRIAQGGLLIGIGSVLLGLFLGKEPRTPPGEP